MHSPAVHPPAPAHAAQAPSHPATPAASGTQVQRVAILVDVDALQRSAQGQGGEVSFARLLRQLTGGRPLVRAVAYATPKSRPGAASLTSAGFEVEQLEEGSVATVAAAVDAMTLASRVDCVVLAPESVALAPLVRALRGQGVRVETASYAQTRGGQGSVAGHSLLGKDSLFIP